MRKINSGFTRTTGGIKVGDYVPKDNSGSLFKLLPDKRKSDNSPEYEGDVKIVCPHCGAPSLAWIKAWIKEAKTGAKFFSLAFKFKTRSGGGQ